MEGAARCGQGLEQGQEGASAPHTRELQVFSLKFSMGFPPEIFMWGRCEVLVCTEELC